MIKSPKRGQSVLEYTMVIALVAMAIIAMYHYVLRGTWAGIKSWEDQMNDSLSEEFGLPVFVPPGSFGFPCAACTNCFPSGPGYCDWTYTKYRIQLTSGGIVEVRVTDPTGSSDTYTISNVNGELQFSDPGKWSLYQVYNAQQQIFDVAYHWGANGPYYFTWTPVQGTMGGTTTTSCMNC